MKKKIIIFVILIIICILVGIIFMFINNKKSDETYYVYVNSETICNIGEKIPDNIVRYTSEKGIIKYTKKIGFPQAYFLRLKLDDEKISEAYIGFVYKHKVYYLRGGGATLKGKNKYNKNIYNNDSPYYEENKEVLKKAFGNKNCDREERYNGTKYYGCDYYIDNYTYISAVADGDGSIFVDDGAYRCDITSEGEANCEYAPEYEE